MKNIAIIFSIFTLLLLSQYNFAQQKERMLVDFTSDETFIIDSGDISYMLLIGNVHMYHNGAVILCDTANYYQKTGKFVGRYNVIINQDSLYIYGDTVTFDKNTGKANVFSPIVKIVDSITTMYTLNLTYDTKTAIAEFHGGGTVEHNDNMMESDEGFYDSKNRVILLRHNVAIQNKDYEIKTDSIDFFLDTEMLDFDCRTYIWRQNGYFLQSDKGKYFKDQELFQCEENSYVLTSEQEVWADSISYYSRIEQLILRNNVQLLDTVKKMYGFGDYGQYWENKKHILLTHNPSIINYFEDGTDSLYMRSDTLFVRPYLNIAVDTTIVISDSLRMLKDEQANEIAIDSTVQKRFGGDIDDDGVGIITDAIDVASELMDSLGNSVAVKDALLDSLGNIIDPAILQDVLLDSLGNSIIEKEVTLDSLGNPIVVAEAVLDSLGNPIVVQDTLTDTRKMTKAQRKVYKKKIRAARKFARKEKFLQWLRDGGMTVIVDTINVDSIDVDSTLIDSSLIVDTLATKVVVENVADSSDYLIRGFLNSKIFRTDLQAVCDSVITETVDSTTTFIGSPIMWNENNQITANRIRAFTKNQELYRARLFGKPILGQLVLDSSFTQIKGDYMDAMFRDNSIYRLYVNEASETLYYKVTDPPIKELESLTFITSVNMIIDIDSTQITLYKCYTDIKTITYPMDKISPDQVTELQGFKWQPEKKPSKEEIFDRKIVDSYRDVAIEITKPYFVISEMIENRKKEYIKKNMWRDRFDVISPEQKVFKGFKVVNK